MSIKEFFFGKDTKLTEESIQDTREQVRKWTRDLQREQRRIDRDITNLKNEEAKEKRNMAKLAKEGASKKSLMPLAKALTHSAHSRDKLLVTKTHLNSVIMTLQEMAAQARVAKSLQSSTELMQQMSRLLSLPAVQVICRDMAQEMYRTGAIAESIDDAFTVMDNDEIEDEAEDEVNKVLDEVLDGIMIQGNTLKQKQSKTTNKQTVESTDQDEEDALVAQLAGLNTK